MYIRFVVAEQDESSGRRMGLFHATGDLRDSGTLANYEEDLLKEIRDWFDRHLDRPDRFSSSRKPNAKGVAISWFKGTAVEHVARMRQMAAILESHGYDVHVIKTNRPGYVVYEDRYQIAAEPYADTPT